MAKKVKKARNKKKQVRKKKAWILDVPIGVCVILMVMGLLIGNVFVMIIWNEGRLIDKCETIPVTATFDSYMFHTSPKGSLDSVELLFNDHEKLYIDDACFDGDVKDALDRLEKGDRVDLLLHPVSGDVWEMESEELQILSFDDAKRGTFFENLAFTMLFGFFGYFVAIIAVISLLCQWKEYRKIKKERY